MTATTTGEHAFLSRIAANPADDTDRLVYADWLDEHSGEVPCRRCNAEGTVGISRHPRGKGFVRHDCTECCGTGRVPDGRRERAEFIRVQCELARNPRTARTCQHCGCDDGCNHNTGCLYSREAELRTAHETDWRRAGACVACRGMGAFVASTRANTLTRDCPHCWGSGDIGGLLRAVSAEWNGGGRFGTAVPLRVDFERGFPHRVHCRLEDVVLASHDIDVAEFNPRPSVRGRTAIEANTWRPTPWALAVVRHHPVTQFRVDVPFRGGIANAWYSDEIPVFLMPLIQGHDSSTPDAAHTAMAAALAAWVRAFPAGS